MGGGGAERAAAQACLFRAERLAGSPADNPPLQLPIPVAALLGPGPYPSPLEQKPPSGLVSGRKVNRSFHFELSGQRCSEWCHP